MRIHLETNVGLDPFPSIPVLICMHGHGWGVAADCSLKFHRCLHLGSSRSATCWSDYSANTAILVVRRGADNDPSDMHDLGRESWR